MRGGAQFETRAFDIDLVSHIKCALSVIRKTPPHPYARRKAAFGDLWSTIAAGKRWQGYVKNLRKDGRHYWVSENSNHRRLGVAERQPAGSRLAART